MSRAVDLLDPDAYVRDGYPWQAWAELRRHDPVSRRRHGEVGDYWALVRHAEIVAVSRRPRDFISSPRLNMPPRRAQDVAAEESFPRRCSMDPPRLGGARGDQRHFTPRALRALEPRIAGIAREVVERAVALYGDGRSFDFVGEVSARLPLAVIMELLGVPRADWETLLVLANQTVGAGDPEYNQGAASAIAAAVAAREAMFEVFARHIAERRRPRRD
jgi:cholest-4-en-3-one 26-monooxygenase